MHPDYILTKDESFTAIENYCSKIRVDKITRAVKLADLSDNRNLQCQALLKEQGHVIVEEEYPRVKSLLKASVEEEQWFSSAISKRVLG